MKTLTIERQFVPELVGVELKILELKDKWFTSSTLIELCGVNTTRSLSARLGHYLKARGDVHIKTGTQGKLYLLDK